MKARRAARLKMATSSRTATRPNTPRSSSRTRSNSSGPRLPSSARSSYARHAHLFVTYSYITRLKTQAQAESQTQSQPGGASPALFFSDIVPIASTTTQVAAAAFYHLLALASGERIGVEQEGEFGEVSPLPHARATVSLADSYTVFESGRSVSRSRLRHGVHFLSPFPGVIHYHTRPQILLHRASLLMLAYPQFQSTSWLPISSAISRAVTSRLSPCKRDVNLLRALFFASPLDLITVVSRNSRP